MAQFYLDNSAGFGFDMSTTGDSGFAVTQSDPNLAYEYLGGDADTYFYRIHGSSTADQAAADFTLYSDGIVINNFHMGWSYAADPYLSVIGVDMFISQADAESGASAWMVRLNGQSDSFFGNDYNDVIRAGFGNDLVVGYAGNDILMGDDGNDTLGGGAGYDLLNGGTGYDTVSYAGFSYHYSFSLNADGSVTMFDPTGGYGTDIIVNVEAVHFDNGLFSLSSLLPVFSPPTAPDVPQQAALTGTNGSNTINGNSANNVIKGLGGADKLYGLGGNDKLYGGLGNDSLYGGTGKDAFVFDYKPNARTNKDAVKDFRVVDDTLWLDNGDFTKVGSNGALKSSAFYANKTGKAHDASDRIVYDKDSGVLYYDADGTGKAAGIAFATIAKNLSLTHKDFLVI